MPDFAYLYGKLAGDMAELAAKYISEASAIMYKRHEEDLLLIAEIMCHDIIQPLRKIETISKNKRRDFVKSTETTHVSCIAECFGGRCPCCLSAVVIDNGQKLPIARNEHYHAPYRNDLKDTWITCDACNRNLEKPEFHSSKLPLFMAYQLRLKVFIEEREPQSSLVLAVQ